MAAKACRLQPMPSRPTASRRPQARAPHRPGTANYTGFQPAGAWGILPRSTSTILPTPGLPSAAPLRSTAHRKCKNPQRPANPLFQPRPAQQRSAQQRPCATAPSAARALLSYPMRTLPSQVQKAANSCNSVFPARYVGALRGLHRYPGASSLGGPIGFRPAPHETAICRHPAPQTRFPNLALRSSALCHSAVRGTARKREKPQTTSGGRTEPQAEARPASRFRRELAGWHAGQ